ncbi:hypothetical protein Cgig2_002702 [Carnegiea gigantea]|uniref:Uncharacterized protein n=1 Tax=Carnegiea gigantea TaxID=171969 RepID=A0A9Q1KQB5_9CARY|nr:hypothetical protein Cgig2_002702 [Carnegiea gigantea]
MPKLHPESRRLTLPRLPPLLSHLAGAGEAEVSDGSQPCNNIIESEHASSCPEPNTTPSPGILQPSAAQPSHRRPPLHPNAFIENEFTDLEPDDTGTQSRKPRQLKSIVWHHFRRVNEADPRAVKVDGKEVCEAKVTNVKVLKRLQPILQQWSNDRQ